MYKSVCDDLNINFTCVGSTTNFAKRKCLHKSRSNDDKYRNQKVYKVINEHGGWENWSMIKLESCICESTLDARKRERYFYEELNANTMNTYRPMRTSEELKEEVLEWSKQYYINNEATIKEYQKQYYIDNETEIKEKVNKYNIANKETISARVAEKIHCKACNCYHHKGDIARHIKSPKHQNNINKLQNTA